MQTWHLKTRPGGTSHRLASVWLWCALWAFVYCGGEVWGDNDPDREPIRAAIPRADEAPVIDGKLTEYDRAFCTPLEYFHPDLKNRPAQFYYLWDDVAFYVGVRTLDEKPFAPDDPFWVGDAVEWYFDTRRAPAHQRLVWGPGAVHCFFTALEGEKVKPRFSLRPGYEEAIPQLGIQVAGRRTGQGMEYELKLPWSNFPDFQPKNGARLRIDAELSYSDGVSRSFRSFVFGSPLSVERPANLAAAKLVDKFHRDDWRPCGPVIMPMRVDVPWNQDGEPRVRAQIAMPPNRSADVGKVTFQLTDMVGNVVASFDAVEEEVFDSQGKFARRIATWPTTAALTAAYHVQAIVCDHQGNELTRVAPRLVSVNMQQGY